jgi:predicted nucleotide-binding protein
LRWRSSLTDTGARPDSQAGGKWDAFISHAYEDKAAFVADLAPELTSRELTIWYDDDVLEVGDSVRRAVDEGLRESDFGIVVISPDFIRKDWTNRELDGRRLGARQEASPADLASD